MRFLSGLKRAGFPEEQEGKPLLGVCEVRGGFQAEEAELLLEPAGLELPADLNEDRVSFVPDEGCSERREEDLSTRSGDRVHFDLPPFRVIPRVVAHFPSVKVAVRETVDVLKNVKDEIGRYSVRIIVSLLQNLYLFDPVHSEQEKIFGAHGITEVVKEAIEFRWTEVS